MRTILAAAAAAAAMLTAAAGCGNSQPEPVRVDRDLLQRQVPGTQKTAGPDTKPKPRPNVPQHPKPEK